MSQVIRYFSQSAVNDLGILNMVLLINSGITTVSMRVYARLQIFCLRVWCSHVLRLKVYAPSFNALPVSFLFLRELWLFRQSSGRQALSQLLSLYQIAKRRFHFLTFQGLPIEMGVLEKWMLFELIPAFYS
jgi:hypothetical protein